MKLENWLEKLEMESLEDMAYLDAFCYVMEADEALPEEIFHQLFSGVTEEEIREMMDQYLEEVMSGISEDCIDFYSFLSSYRRSFKGMVNYLIREDRRERVVGELFRFREWYRDPEAVLCTDLDDEREFAASVCESLILGRMEKLAEGNFRFDFSGAMDMEFDEYEEYIDEEEEDYLDMADDDPRLTLIDPEDPVIDGEDYERGESYLQ
ncbi:MAG: hypothetical protein IJG57_05005 [Firmicutes bacterium]|nr:hypothetical protein [Bacillota bacterium]